MIRSMLTRTLRLWDRIGRLLVKLCLMAGRQLHFWLSDTLYRLRPANSPYMAEDAQQPQGQVNSLSGLIVTLLAAVVFVIFWATGDSSESSAFVSFLSAGSPQPDTSSPLTESQPEIIIEPVVPVAASGSIAVTMYDGATQGIFGLEVGQAGIAPLVTGTSDSRQPTWSPDSRYLAFSSHRDGNWELYVLDANTGETRRLTYDLAYEGAPSWSPDGLWLAYEASYQGNLDIYIIKSDGSEGPYPVTSSTAPDYAPAWSPVAERNELAYVSLREGNAEIYILALSDPAENRATNITRSASVPEDSPHWSPDGTRLAYSAVEDGVSLVYVANADGSSARVVGQGFAPCWSPDGSRLAFVSERSGGSLLSVVETGSWETTSQTVTLPNNNVSSISWTGQKPAVLSTAAAPDYAPALAYEETFIVEAQPGIDPPYRVINLQPLGITADSPYLSDRVDGSFYALKEYMRQAAGWDVLSQLDSMFWEELTRPAEPGQDFRNWHKAGRAFDVMQAYNDSTPAQVELVPEYRGPDLYWRLYVRCAQQDGSCGQPLRQRPWDFQARFGGDVDAYENGGKQKNEVPSGYYVDFTQAAELFGWQPVPSDSSWRYNWTGILWWQYEKHDGLDWWSAMRELYSDETLVTAFGTSQ